MCRGPVVLPSSSSTSRRGDFARSPQLLPGGDSVLFTVAPGASARRAYLWEQAQIVVQSLSTGERTVVIEGGYDARYLPTGHLVYALNSVLLAVPFDVDSREVTGGPVPVVEGVADQRLTGAAHFAVASNGALVYVPTHGGGRGDSLSRMGGPARRDDPGNRRLERLRVPAALAG